MLILLALSVTLLFYVYAGYPLFLWVLCRLKPARSGSEPSAFRPVSIVIPAHNEEDAIAGKVASLRALRYPADSWEIILVSDGSSDRTVERFEQAMTAWRQSVPAPAWRTVALPQQVGKSLAENEGARLARHEILLFTDAGTTFDSGALSCIAKAFDDPRIGCASARLTYIAQAADAASDEGFYWRYERWIRRMESDLGILAMGSGSMLALRRELFQPLPASEGEDWVLPLRAREAGFRVVQVEDAIVYDSAVSSTAGLFRTKVRIISKDCHALRRRSYIMNPFLYGWTAVGLLSHKFLRWLSFLWMTGALSANVLAAPANPALQIFLGLQLGAYGLAVLGAISDRWGWSLGPFTRPARALYHFCVVQAASAQGVWQAVTDRPQGIWQPIRSKEEGESEFIF